MALEVGTFIDDLVSTNPVSATDLVRYGAGHLRLLKETIKNSFAGAGGNIMTIGADAGTANTIVISPTPSLTEYTTRMIIVWLQLVTNTGATTINISGLGAKSVVSVANAALASGDLVAGRVYVGIYDGTSVQLEAVTKNYVDQLAFNTVLPAQPGTAYYSTLRSISGTAAFGAQSICDIRSITTTDTVGAADIGNLIDCTSGTFTLTFAAAATLGDRSSGYIRNSGTGDVTIDGNGAETIDGIANFIMYPGEVRLWVVEGSAIKTIVLQRFQKVFTSSGTFTRPPGYKNFLLVGIGGGGGGGSGYRGSSAGDRRGGGGGGGGAYAVASLSYDALSATETITIGAGGTGGAAQTVDSSAGINGVVGGNVSIGTHLIAVGGNFGVGGGTGSFGTAGALVEGLPSSGYNGLAGGAGASGAGASAGASGVTFGGTGGGGGAGNTGGVTTARAGGDGGGLAAATISSGSGRVIAASAGGTAGGTAAVAGTSSATSLRGGTGGGGGFYITGQATGSGANGGLYGGGGGGGSASDNSFNSGAGGTGGNGVAVIYGGV